MNNVLQFFSKYEPITEALNFIVSAILVGIIGFKQINQTKKQQKMDLFDKRYKIYTYFNKCFKLSEGIAIWTRDKAKGKSCEYINLRDALYNNIVDNVYRYDEYMKADSLWNDFIFNDMPSEKKEEYLKEYNRLNKKMFNEDLLALKEYTSVLEMSKFCFSEDISSVIEKFSEIIFRWSTYSCGEFLNEKSKNEYIKEKESIRNEIIEKRIFEKMSNYLSIQN